MKSTQTNLTPLRQIKSRNMYCYTPISSTTQSFNKIMLFQFRIQHMRNHNALKIKQRSREQIIHPNYSTNSIHPKLLSHSQLNLSQMPDKIKNSMITHQVSHNSMVLVSNLIKIYKHRIPKPCLTIPDSINRLRQSLISGNHLIKSQRTVDTLQNLTQELCHIYDKELLLNKK